MPICLSHEDILFGGRGWICTNSPEGTDLHKDSVETVALASVRRGSLNSPARPLIKFLVKVVRFELTQSYWQCHTFTACLSLQGLHLHIWNRLVDSNEDHPALFGADKEVRTPDILLGKQTFYRLNYIRIFSRNLISLDRPIYLRYYTSLFKCALASSWISYPTLARTITSALLSDVRKLCTTKHPEMPVAQDLILAPPRGIEPRPPDRQSRIIATRT